MIQAQSMEAHSAAALPEGDGWWFEPKWDGFRCLAFKDGDEVRLQARSGKPLTRFFPEVAEHLAAIEARRFVLDGELLIAIDGVYAFEALQMRLHPAASRIARLCRETPAILMLFDMLMDENGRDLRAEPHSRRHKALAAFVERHGDQALRLTDGTADRARAQAWLDEGALEGVVAKRSDGPYAEGERAMVKVKRGRTADCVVGGFRYGEGGKVVGSLLLGLYDASGHLDHVGFTSGLASADRPALTRRLETLRGGPGFTGRAPGGPSRWSTERSGEWEPLRPELVVEVAFDHVTDGRFRHGTRLLRFRPDKAPRQCTLDQLAQ
jgi:ATP-dependent DNA ligase